MGRAQDYVNTRTHEQWEHALGSLVVAEGVGNIMAVPGVYELVRDHYHNEVYDLFLDEYHDKVSQGILKELP